MLSRKIAQQVVKSNYFKSNLFLGMQWRGIDTFHENFSAILGLPRVFMHVPACIHVNHICETTQSGKSHTHCEYDDFSRRRRAQEGEYCLASVGPPNKGEAGGCLGTGGARVFQDVGNHLHDDLKIRAIRQVNPQNKNCEK
jgi:hypothetical protein